MEKASLFSWTSRFSTTTTRKAEKTVERSTQHKAWLTLQQLGLPSLL
jgi:hypothetical protein